MDETLNENPSDAARKRDVESRLLSLLGRADTEMSKGALQELLMEVNAIRASLSPQVKTVNVSGAIADAQDKIEKEIRSQQQADAETPLLVLMANAVPGSDKLFLDFKSPQLVMIMNEKGDFADGKPRQEWIEGAQLQADVANVVYYTLDNDKKPDFISYLRQVSGNGAEPKVDSLHESLMRLQGRQIVHDVQKKQVTCEQACEDTRTIFEQAHTQVDGVIAAAQATKTLEEDAEQLKLGAQKNPAIEEQAKTTSTSALLAGLAEKFNKDKLGQILKSGMSLLTGEPPAVTDQLVEVSGPGSQLHLGATHQGKGMIVT